MNRTRIAFFDSGMGGLTVMNMAIAAYPAAQYIYYADIAHVPYGKKKKKQIRKYVKGAVEFLISKKIDILVIACNTATSVCIKELRRDYDLPIIGMEPAVKPAVKLLTQPQQKILVCATKLTLKEKKLKDLITNLEADDRTNLLSLQKLVAYAEKGNFKGKKVRKYLKQKFSDFDWKNYSALVLGCTHFRYYIKLIRKMIPDHIAIIDGNTGTVNRLLHFLPELSAQEINVEPASIEVYFSSKQQNPASIQPYLDFLNTNSQKS